MIITENALFKTYRREKEINVIKYNLIFISRNGDTKNSSKSRIGRRRKIF